MERQAIRYPKKQTTVGRVQARGQAFTLGGDSYFGLLTRPLWQFMLGVGVVFVAINAVFGFLYTLDPGGISNARPGSFEDAFFFSVQTLATIGYGSMAPQTRYAHIIVTVEALLGALSLGSIAGVAFARFSRPEARVIFSEKMVVRPRNGVRHLQLRAANWRTNMVVEASLRFFLLVLERTDEGEEMRKPLEVKLVRASSPFFFLTWTAMHAIDETSPFFGEGAIERLRKQQAQVFVALTGYDQTLGQMVHAYKEFSLDDIVEGARFSDVVTLRPDGTREIDFARFHDIEVIARTSNDAPASPEA